MKPHKRHLLFLLVLLAAIPAIPTMAGAEGTPMVEAVNVGAYGEEHHWSPPTLTLSSGNTVAFKNSTPVLHGVEWRAVPATPTCSGVPVGTTSASSGANWSGTCTFPRPGRYAFYCTVHGEAMSGAVIVSNGITTITQSTTQTTSSGSTTTTSTTTTSGSTPESTPGAVLVGNPSTAIKLAASQRGKLVRGSVDVGPGGAGGTLEVDVLANSARLAKAKHATQTRVGRLVRTSLTAGPVSFKVALNAKARRALRVRRRLALTVKIVLTPKTGAAVKVTRHVVLHA